MTEPLEPVQTDSFEQPLAAEDPWAGSNAAATVAFLVYDATGRILRTGYCALRDLRFQAQAGETVLEGQANDRLQKVVDGRVVEKTSEEIAATQRPAVPVEKQRASISQEQWDLFQNRFAAIEERLRRIEQRPSGGAG